MGDNQHSCFYVEVHVNAPMFNFPFDDSFLCMYIKKKGENTMLVPEVCLLCVFGLLSFE